MQVASKRCGLAARTGFLRAKAEMPLRDGHTARLGNGLVLKCRCGLASTRRFEAVLVLKCRCELPLRTAAPHAAAGCRPAPLGSSFASSNAAAGFQPAPPESSFGAQMPLRAESPRRLKAALVVKCYCGLRACTAWKQLRCSNAAVGCQPALLGSSFGAASCQPAPLGSRFGAQMPLRAASPHRLENSFGAQMPPWCSNARTA